MTYKALRPHPDFPMAHPGELLVENIKAMEITKAEMARRLGVTRKALYDVLNGSSGVSAPMALKLEKAVGGSAEMWLGMQTQHDLWKARQAEKKAKKAA